MRTALLCLVFLAGCAPEPSSVAALSPRGTVASSPLDEPPQSRDRPLVEAELIPAVLVRITRRVRR